MPALFRAARARLIDAHLLLAPQKSLKLGRQISFPKSRWKKLSKSLRKPLENRETARVTSGLHSLLCERATLYPISNLGGYPKSGPVVRRSNAERSIFFHIDKRFYAST